MTFEANLVGHLRGDSSITALVGERITPQPVPEGAPRPAITYLIVSEDAQTTLDSDEDGLLEVRAQIDCWAGNQADARRLAELVRIRMQTSSFKAIPTPGSSYGDYESTTKLHRFSRDFTCWHST